MHEVTRILLLDNILQTKIFPDIRPYMVRRGGMCWEDFLKIAEKDRQSREAHVRKVGAGIVQASRRYHLLINYSSIPPRDYEIEGKFAHLRGLALTEEGESMPVVYGQSGTLGVLPSFRSAQLYRSRR